MPNLFQKLENNTLIHTGIIFIPEVIERETYNRLYEWQGKWEWEQNWTNFKNNYKVNFKFLENLEDIDVSKETICLWFFRERPETAEYRKYCRDNNLDPYKDFKEIVIEGKNIQYLANTILITNKKIKFLENKFVLRRPCVQIDIRSIDIQSRKKIKRMLKRILD